MPFLFIALSLQCRQCAIHPSIHRSIHLSMHPSIYLSLSQFLKMFMWNRALATVLCTHFLSAAFPHQGPNPRKQRPYFGHPMIHFTLKHGVLSPRVSSHMNSAFWNYYSSLHTASARELLLLIMLLTWWWHDDKTAPGHSSVSIPLAALPSRNWLNFLQVQSGSTRAMANKVVNLVNMTSPRITENNQNVPEFPGIKNHT